MKAVYTVKTRLFKTCDAHEVESVTIDGYYSRSFAIRGFIDECNSLIAFIEGGRNDVEYQYQGEVTLQPEGGEIIGHLNL